MGTMKGNLQTLDMKHQYQDLGNMEEATTLEAGPTANGGMT